MNIPSLRSRLESLFGPASSPLFAIRAPGRVNLIGEHTDYNGGFVCPMAIDRETLIIARPRTDAVVQMHSLPAGEAVQFLLDKQIPIEGPRWSLFARGAVEAMRRKGKIQRGFDCIVDSTVPLGGGLSSSASFEVATALAALTVNQAAIDKVELALSCQWAEHHYADIPCGIMDPFSSVMGQKGDAMLLDCRDQSVRYVPIGGAKGADIRVVISNSNVKHELGGGEYGVRRKQCEAAVAVIQKKHSTVHLLRDATSAMLEESRSGMDEIVYRRARHVITEIARTTQFAGGLEKQEYRRCGELMYASHASLRDDYEVSCAELDALVEIARTVPGVYGARMTGGGFGGCIVALCDTAAVEPLTAAIEALYPARAEGKHATTFATAASAGASAQAL